MVRSVAIVTIGLLAIGPLGPVGCLAYPMSWTDDQGGHATDDDDLWGDDDGDDDDWDDDDGDYVGPFQGIPSLYVGCNIDVPYTEPDQAPPPSGNYVVDMELAGWASTCWVEMWDGTSDYCEGYDQNGDPCSYAGEMRPGWAMEQEVSHGHDAGGFYEGWSLDLDYVLVWPPEPDASLLMCENSGLGANEATFYIYACCCDEAQLDHCACVHVN